MRHWAEWVAIGNNRNSGSSLGSFNLNANNALSYSNWQTFPTSSRYVNICGFRESVRSTKLYRRIWHRIMRNVDKLRSDPENEKLYRSLMSRLGWLKAINRECSKPFEEERGKLWK